MSSTPTPAAQPTEGIIPYLNVDGAMKAADFYARAFAAQTVFAMPPDEQGRTMHAYLRINDGAVYLSDFYPEHGVGKVAPQAFNLHLQVDDVEQWFARAVDAGCTVRMPLADMFWGDRYGMVIDPFGVTWGLGQHLEGAKS